MTRDTRRRVALYGGAAVLGLLVVAVPRIITRLVPAVKIRKLDVDTAKAHEATKMLVDLIRIDTSDPPGIVRPAIDYLAYAFACEGIPYDIVGDDPERPILVARLAGQTKDGGLLLLNHIDVVPPGDLTKWVVPPFAGEMGKGTDTHYLYGRGTLDMKGQAVATFYGMARLKRDGIVPRRDIVYVAEGGEELFDAALGIGWVVKHRPDLLEGVTDAINEGGVNETVASDIKRFGIEVLQKATVSIYVHAKASADLERFRDFLVDRDKSQPYRLVPAVREFMQFIGPSRNDIWGRSMVSPDRALQAVWFRQWAPEVYKSLVRDALYPGSIEKEGDGFRMELAETLLPGSPTAAALARLEGWIAERGMTRTIRFVTPDSIAAPQSGRTWDVLNTVLSLDPEKAEVGSYVLTVSYTNSSYLRALGYHAYGVSPFNVNINDAAKIHGANERIILPYFVEGAERMERILREFATCP